MKLRTITATRYVTPLREGGSLPAIVEAELVVGELARAAGLAIPEIVLIELDADLARTEPDPEIQQLIRASAGLNLALDYLPGSVTFDPIADTPDATTASSIVWLDAYVSNVDRTPRNANMLMWHKKLWLIDHGAALYFHHGWSATSDHSKDAFTRIKDHILLKFASALKEVDATLTARLTPEVIRDIVALAPDEWLKADSPFATPQDARNAYAQHLTRRLQAPRAFLEEAIRARALLV
jgi:hypothetical protein